MLQKPVVKNSSEQQLTEFLEQSVSVARMDSTWRPPAPAKKTSKKTAPSIKKQPRGVGGLGGYGETTLAAEQRRDGPVGLQVRALRRLGAVHRTNELGDLSAPPPPPHTHTGEETRQASAW